jgi:hypothetical protein
LWHGFIGDLQESLILHRDFHNGLKKFRAYFQSLALNSPLMIVRAQKNEGSVDESFSEDHTCSASTVLAAAI